MLDRFEICTKIVASNLSQYMITFRQNNMVLIDCIDFYDEYTLLRLYFIFAQTIRIQE